MIADKRSSRSIHVDCDTQTVTAFLSQPENLTRWTSFFRSVTRQADGSYRTATVRGWATTEVIVDAIRADETSLRIRTRFATLVETAWLLVRTAGAGCDVRFVLQFPPELSPNQRARVLDGVQQDLQALSGLLARAETPAGGVLPKVAS